MNFKNRTIFCLYLILENIVFSLTSSDNNNEMLAERARVYALVCGKKFLKWSLVCCAYEGADESPGTGKSSHKSL